MTRSKYSDSEIMSILKQASSGVPVASVFREHNISSATFYKWRSSPDHISTNQIVPF